MCAFWCFLRDRKMPMNKENVKNSESKLFVFRERGRKTIKKAFIDFNLKKKSQYLPPTLKKSWNTEKDISVSPSTHSQNMIMIHSYWFLWFSPLDHGSLYSPHKVIESDRRIRAQFYNPDVVNAVGWRVESSLSWFIMRQFDGCSVSPGGAVSLSDQRDSFWP